MKAQGLSETQRQGAWPGLRMELGSFRLTTVEEEEEEERRKEGVGTGSF